MVFMGTDDADVSWGCMYSSETGEWNLLTSIKLDSYVEMVPSLLIKHTLYFVCENGMRILGYGIGRHELSVIDLPLGHNIGTVMRAEDLLVWRIAASNSGHGM
ncbi:hypothetical protein GUJ93_ZPchr0007g3431 [Zizania palustris]|uniref:F-box associated domain-containing protein n=1 Tax=Zizania palustris TaxID=103762 RepID=A0A8J5VUD9_ZIZPA|nr:hypothetical protein GUJ93_ZPchr0007g3431 [Zizania palustris]